LERPIYVREGFARKPGKSIVSGRCGIKELCPKCKSESVNVKYVPRVNRSMLYIARVVGVVAIAGVFHGIVIALSGFGGHYGAYPGDELIVKSLLVGIGVVSVNVAVAALVWRAFGSKRVFKCSRCDGAEAK